MKKTFAAFFVCLVIIGFYFPTLVLAAFQYEHDPMENPRKLLLCSKLSALNAGITKAARQKMMRRVWVLQLFG